MPGSEQWRWVSYDKLEHRGLCGVWVLGEFVGVVSCARSRAAASAEGSPQETANHFLWSLTVRVQARNMSVS
ncbi:hypothetical protein GUJ93_ZPchr0006g44242 [Zizania palustris]|uniref:Uncharacterized protein n=1 Tax=Zizania palustris TaxID=103762 RepID=A0A8J5W3Q0_ZIZPA|nr:hypothetical protein GUJ93_ZPchr0006g44242 [Zizania palustris]